MIYVVFYYQECDYEAAVIGACSDFVNAKELLRKDLASRIEDGTVYAEESDYTICECVLDTPLVTERKI